MGHLSKTTLGLHLLYFRKSALFLFYLNKKNTIPCYMGHLSTTTLGLHLFLFSFLSVRKSEIKEDKKASEIDN